MKTPSKDRCAGCSKALDRFIHATSQFELSSKQDNGFDIGYHELRIVQIKRLKEYILQGGNMTNEKPLYLCLIIAQMFCTTRGFVKTRNNLRFLINAEQVYYIKLFLGTAS